MSVNLPQTISLRLENWLVTGARALDSGYVFSVKYQIQPARCPCGSADFVRNGSRKITCIDEPYERVPTALEIKRYRYYCRKCRQSFKQPMPELSEERRATNRYLRYIEAEVQEKNPVAVARAAGVSVNTVRSIFTAHAGRIESESAPVYDDVKYLGIDEIYFNKTMHGVFSDLTRKPGQLLDIFRDREDKTIFNKLREMRDGASDVGRLRAVVTDMYLPYRKIVRKVFPNVRMIVDKFHLLRKADEAVTDCRIALLGKLNDGNLNKTERVQLHELSDALYKRKKGKKLSDNPLLLERWLALSPQIVEAFYVKEAFYDIFTSPDFKTKSRAQAESEYDEWVKSMSPQMKPHFKSLVGNVKTWRDEIFSYFEFTPRLTNAPTESINKKLRKRKHVEIGYTFEVFRAKMLRGQAAEYREIRKSHLRRSQRSSEMDQLSKFIGFDLWPQKEAAEKVYLGANIDKLLEMLDDGKF